MGAFDAAVGAGSRLGKLATEGERVLVLIVGAELEKNVESFLCQQVQFSLSLAFITLDFSAQKAVQ